MKTGPFKMKGKSPMMKALIGDQGNLNAGLRSAIEASPTTMKKESSMKMMKKSPAKKIDILNVVESDRKDRTDARKPKRSYAEAYKKRDMKTYGNLSQEEYTKEAKRQTSNKKSTTVKPTYSSKGKKGSFDAPKSQMKGSVTGPKTKDGDATNQKAVKTTTTTKTTPKVTVKKPKTVKEAKAARKTARKSVRAARKEFGRGSAEVKAAKTTKKAAKQEVKTAKKTRKTVKKVARVTKRAIKRGTKAADKFIKKFNKENA